MHLISASRRTDLPAFYADWLLERLRAGTASWVNPYSGKLSIVSLAERDVGAIVFWTRNFAPMLRHLDELEGMGHRYLIHFTVTGLPRRFETHVPSTSAAVNQLQRLARRIGASRVLWRYDPIVVSEETSPDFHRRTFAELARALGGATRQCSISFAQIYGKLKRNFHKHDLPIPAPLPTDRLAVASELTAIGARHGIAVKSCCNDDLLAAGAGKARCVDRAQVLAIWPHLDLPAPPAPTREECGCSRSFDLGAYDTCLHGCHYCYATKDRETAKARRFRHDPGGTVLIPPGDSTGRGESG